MSKIDNENKARELFGYSASFATYNLSSVAEERKDLPEGELTDTISDEETRKAIAEIRERQIERRKEGRGRPKNKNSELETRMTFIVSKEQLLKLKEIGYRKRLFVKEILFSALQKYISDYEAKYGEIKIDTK